MMNNKGFSLVELAMVIAIIAMLASIAETSYSNLKIYIARSELQTFINYIQDLRASDPEVLHVMTGNLWTDEGFNAHQTLNKQHAAMAVNDTSWKNLGFPNGAPIDPWGNPFTIDENEQNFGPNYCVYDVIVSAGPDGLLNGWVGGPTDDVYAIVPFLNCTVGPVPPTSGTQW